VWEGIVRIVKGRVKERKGRGGGDKVGQMHREGGGVVRETVGG
jgi:hypothetical protein